MRPSRRRRPVHRTSRIESMEPRLFLSAHPVGDPFFDSFLESQLHGDVRTSLVDVNDLTGLGAVRTDYGFTGAGQTVAVIDTGIAYRPRGPRRRARRRLSRRRRLRLRRTRRRPLRRRLGRRPRQPRGGHHRGRRRLQPRRGHRRRSGRLAGVRRRGPRRFRPGRRGPALGPHEPLHLREPDHHGQPLAGKRMEFRRVARLGHAGRRTGPVGGRRHLHRRGGRQLLRQLQPAGAELSGRQLPRRGGRLGRRQRQSQLFLAARRDDDRRAGPRHPQQRARLCRRPQRQGRRFRPLLGHQHGQPLRGRSRRAAARGL